jgi:hypothetical protein
MIQDRVELQGIRDSWQSLQEYERAANLTIVKAFMSGLPAGTRPPELFWSLLLIFAYAVLEEALLELRDQSVFACPDSRLKPLMAASRSALTWVNFVEADEGRERRNDIAHRQVLIDPNESKKYIACIQTELKAWGVLL